MNVFEEQLIEAFLSPDEARYNRAVKVMFYEDNSVARTCREVVNLCFQGPKYRGQKNREDLYNVFVSLFCIALRRKAAKLREVENLAAWMHKVTRNFCNQYRDQINCLYGIDPYGKSVDFDDKYDIDTGEEDEPKETKEGEEENAEPDVDDQPSDADPFSDEFIDVIDDTDDQGDSDHDESVKRRLAKYLDALLASKKENARYYHDLIVNVHLLGKTNSEVAAMFGRPPGGISTDLQNARNALVSAANEDIKRTCKAMFKIYGPILLENQYKVLQDFFDDKPVSPNKVAEAWRALRTIALRDEKKQVKEAQKDDRKKEKQENKIKKYEL